MAQIARLIGDVDTWLWLVLAYLTVQVVGLRHRISELENRDRERV
jgi:hypothetical protein